jgi:hypothetical protein
VRCAAVCILICRLTLWVLVDTIACVTRCHLPKPTVLQDDCMRTSTSEETRDTQLSYLHDALRA